MNRGKELEIAVERLLNLNKFSFMRIDNYRCFHCGTVQNSKVKGAPDFFVYHPFVFACEVKTGSGRLTDQQKIIKNKMQESGIEYLVLRDNVDELLNMIEKLKKTMKGRNYESVF